VCDSDQGYGFIFPVLVRFRPVSVWVGFVPRLFLLSPAVGCLGGLFGFGVCVAFWWCSSLVLLWWWFAVTVSGGDGGVYSVLVQLVCIVLGESVAVEVVGIGRGVEVEAAVFLDVVGLGGVAGGEMDWWTKAVGGPCWAVLGFGVVGFGGVVLVLSGSGGGGWLRSFSLVLVFLLACPKGRGT
jgi:hypothetical protein